MKISDKLKTLQSEVAALEKENETLKANPVSAVPAGTVLSLHLNERQTHDFVRALDYIVKNSKAIRQFNPEALNDFQNVTMLFDFVGDLEGVLKKKGFEKLAYEVEREKKEIDLVFEKWEKELQA